MHHEKFTKGLRGEFSGDVTRDTFDPMRRYSRVLTQQGRVQIDADSNEQNSIMLHYHRALGADLIGPHGAPTTIDGDPGDGFRIGPEGNPFMIMPGHYYVDGILCENYDAVSYDEQPDYPLSQVALDAATYLVYLDVWERHISYVEDDYIREKALGGADTSTRAKIIWQVKLVNANELTLDDGFEPENFKQNHQIFLNALQAIGQRKPGTERMRARARKDTDDDEPCLIQPEAHYRGAENQLYRIEIHRPNNSDGNDATFKWSRENASVLFPVLHISDSMITLEHLGRDCRYGLKPNDWVEFVNDNTVLHNRADKLLQVETVDEESMTITLKDIPAEPLIFDPATHPFLRRWDQRDGDENGVLIVQGNEEQHWTSLEDGVEIQFPVDAAGNNAATVFHTGDYWLVPARTATGDVEWPKADDNLPAKLTAQGVDHHYAPLAAITATRAGNVTARNVVDLRRLLRKSWE